MKHRHLHDDIGFSKPAIDDILEYGRPEDRLELRRAIDVDPFGEVADNVVAICESHEMYGTSRLWPAYVQRVRQRTRESHVR